MAKLQEALSLMKNKDIEKLNILSHQLKEKLYSERFLNDGGEFYDLVGPGAYELNRHIIAESFFPDSLKVNDGYYYAVR